MSNPNRGQAVEIDYTNYRGERRRRRIIPDARCFFWGSNQWHPELQWLLQAEDIEKGELRTFALSGIHSWTPMANDDGAVDGPAVGAMLS